MKFFKKLRAERYSFIFGLYVGQISMIGVMIYSLYVKGHLNWG